MFNLNSILIYFKIEIKKLKCFLFSFSQIFIHVSKSGVRIDDCVSGATLDRRALHPLLLAEFNESGKRIRPFVVCAAQSGTAVLLACGKIAVAFEIVLPRATLGKWSTPVEFMGTAKRILSLGNSKFALFAAYNHHYTLSLAEQPNEESESKDKVLKCSEANEMLSPVDGIVSATSDQSQRVAFLTGCQFIVMKEKEQLSFFGCFRIQTKKNTKSN